MGTPLNTHTADRALRADAQRNRQRVVEAARAVFSERGLEVPLEEIADRAGVGIATLYRRFPTREELVAAVFEVKFLEYATTAEEALRSPDPWTGFCTYVERICAMQAADRGFADVITMVLPTSETAKQLWERGYQGTVEVIRRAQEAGVLRADFVPEDIVLILMANAGVVQVTRDAAPHAWRRLTAYVLEACRADNSGPLPAAPTPAQTEQAMIDYAATKGLHSASRAED
ncbi:helix-turn-helix domain-containing protein [Streptomyces phaeochromogenes]|uniref:TetR/AcrR family transcriptional regulator n=1 Tax=Streptomyces phaeochromogenes TaxID=1923 RepID=UPI002DD8055F|nr:helix-turn-helix domain-containing protein [Streptomyces phaeochromogenes]WRZ34480.1 TetR/AcrR family transcriptional regulator [Streptomyces phaeochromogenes]